jgi:hypothetical protein
MNSLKVFIYGGLGNQIFQYAICRRIADQYDMKLVLCTYGFEQDSFFKREFDLKYFDIRFDSIERGNRMLFQLLRILQHFPLLNRISKILFPNLIVEINNIYENNDIYISQKHTNIYVYGYWHDERYFKLISNNLRNDFSKVIKLSSKNLTIIDEISFENCVSVHMRFSHMIKTGEQNTILEKYQVSSEYYLNALQYFTNKIPGVKFFIFSDQPKLAKDFFNQNDYNCIILDSDRGSDYEDVFVMSKFKFHIIANSSFSWWGAWLADKSIENVVIAPEGVPFTPKIPERWLKM